ncbi:Alpha/Beta hydrolase protein [Naematelia encephala]|uniref:Alpha/Beta hydrolase protein n=1 Tax=Naematelia encephala TaxID=71784 RepID=A0A1Y2BB01_9TREE|nr:Alpha/Beta hydrolase protein [Naematelia encephala]
MLKHHVPVKGHQIYVVEAIPDVPSDAPTVVFMAGLGATVEHWAAVQRLLPSNVRSFAYDRLGLGRSDRTDLPRPASVLAEELHDTLVACATPGPYLFVASSYAGIICREFLEKHDSDVAGLIYVDANHERSQIERRWPIEITTRMADTTAFTADEATGLAEAHGCTPEEWADYLAAVNSARQELAVQKEREAGGAPVRRGEWTLYESSVEALGQYAQLDRQALGTRPLSVIMANLVRDFQRLYEAGKRAGLGSAEDHAIVEEFCARLPEVELRLNYDVLRLSSLHRMIITSISGHLVHLWEPELCVQEIMWCLQHIA